MMNILLLILLIEILLSFLIIKKHKNLNLKFLYNKYIKYRDDFEVIKKCVCKLDLSDVIIFENPINASYVYGIRKINLPYSFDHVLGSNTIEYLMLYV